MESRQLKGLSEAVVKFKAALNEALSSSNPEFRDALNASGILRFHGLSAGNQDPNEYLIEISDLLFWCDSEAYLEELERWEGALITDKHTSTLAYLRDSEQVTVFAGLVEAIKRNRIAPFVGAGLSKPCGFPLWGQSITQLVNKLTGVSVSEQRAAQPNFSYLTEVRQCVDGKDYLQAVQILYRENKAQVDNFIRTKFALLRDAKITGPVSLIPDLSDGCIITTNFDELIENVYQRINRPITGYMHGTQTQHQFVSNLIQGERCILKLHGNVTDPDTYIFSEDQYDAAYGKTLDFTKPLAKTLRQIFISHSLLFLGCSLEQDRTLGLFKFIVQENTFSIPDHYALLDRPKNHQDLLAKEDSLAKAKIRPIWYEVSEASGHAMLEAILQLAIDCAKGRTRIS